METLPQGTLIRAVGGFYTVLGSEGEEITLRCKKKFRHMHISPLVGDEVLYTPGEGEEHGWLEEILPRRSECLRPPVSNVSLLLIVIAPEPAPDLLLVDRLLVRARMQGMHTAIVVNKSELDDSLFDDIAAQYAGADLRVYRVSAATGEGLEALVEGMQGELCCRTGQSGVGKSTLRSRILCRELETGELSEKIRRGKNTTRHAELLLGHGLRVLDTAGFSLLELDDMVMDPISMKEHWPELAGYEGECRFQPCFHDREPGCAVTAAAAEGRIHPERLRRYRLLLEDVRKTWRERYD